MGDPESYPARQKASIVLLRDAGFIAAIVMLVIWAIGTFALAPAPGWLHALLSIGVFLLIHRVVVAGTSAPGGPGRRA